MTRRGIVVTLSILAGAIAAGAFILRTHGSDDPEAQIRKVIEETIAAAETRDVGGIMNRVSQRFKSATMSRGELKTVLFTQLRRPGWRKVFLTDATIDVQDPPVSATVQLDTILASGEPVEKVADLLPQNAARYRFDINFALEDDAWRAVTATYRRLE